MNKKRFFYRGCELIHYSGKYYHFLTYLMCNILTPGFGIILAKFWLKVNECSGRYFRYLKSNGGRRLNSGEQTAICKVMFLRRHMYWLTIIVAFFFWSVVATLVWRFLKV